MSQTPLARLAIGGPGDAHEIPGLVFLVQLPVKGAFYSRADTAWQVDVGRLDNNRLVFLADPDDAIERLLSFFGVLLVARQPNDLFDLLPSENAVQFDDAGREIFVDSPAGRTKRLFAAFGRGRPTPPALMVNGPTLWTVRAIVQLLLPLIGIEEVILLGAPGSATRTNQLPRCYTDLSWR